MVNMTVHQQENHTAQPLLFHLGRDPGEKYRIAYVALIFKKKAQNDLFLFDNQYRRNSW